MDLMQSFDAILFPADGRPPHVVSLMTSPASFSNPHAPAQTSTARVPHPEVHMEYIAEDPNLRAWHYQVCTVFFFYYYRGVSSPCSLHGFLFSTHPAPCTPPNGVNPLVRRRARHDEQEVRAAVHNLLPRRLAGRHAVPREPDRAGHPRGSEQRPPPTRGAALAWEPRRRQVRRRPVHTDDGRVHGRFSHPEELPRHSRVTGQRQRQRWR